MTSERITRVAVFSKTVAFSLSYALVIWLFERFYLSSRITSRALSMAVAVAVVQCAAITAMLGFSFFTKLVRQLRTSRAERVKPRLRELLALQAAGTDGIDEIRRLWNMYPREVEECIVEFLRLVRGRGREALSRCVIDLGLIEKWQRQYRSWNAATRASAVVNLASVSRRLSAHVLHLALLDRDESVRLHTARAMISNLEPGELAQVFGLAVNGPLVTRMILAEDLRRYALDLAKEAIPAVLTCGVSGPVLSALQMVRAWGKFLPLSEVYPLLRHPNPAVRAAAFDVLPLVPQAEPMKTEILYALNDRFEEVRSAAARAAATIRVYEAVPLLARQLQESHTTTALAAASALADLGADGCRILEEETIAGSPLTASVALEALERVRIASVETVAV
ncbi:MAG: hypothetical protein JWO48_325 [Bryobacterales bacterium]|nr:hypothetical protein [Bryobacterales bacterium]